MITVADDDGQPAVPPAIVVVQNWTEELKRLVPRSHERRALVVRKRFKSFSSRSLHGQGPLAVRS